MYCEYFKYDCDLFRGKELPTPHPAHPPAIPPATQPASMPASQQPFNLECNFKMGGTDCRDGESTGLCHARLIHHQSDKAPITERLQGPPAAVAEDDE